MSPSDEFAGTGQPGRAGADHRHAFARGLRGRRQVAGPVGALPVRRESFEVADGDGPALAAEDARRLALGFLGADAPADGREGVGQEKVVGRRLERALGDPFHESGNVDPDGAPGHALRFLADEAAAGLGLGLLRRVAERDLVEIPDALLGRPLGHRHAAGRRRRCRLHG